MLLHPPCKINLGLRVLRRRPDGYHDLETIFLPVPFLHDDLEIIPSPTSATSHTSPTSITLTGIPLDSGEGDNLCMKAYSLLKADFPDLPPVQIRLHKRIPFGAGLGGGSADAAFTLKGLNDLFDLGITTAQLEAYAARLGADCAFFIQCRPALAEGIGDRLTPLDNSQLSILNSQFSISHLLLAKPADAVSTREAYANLKLDDNANRARHSSPKLGEVPAGRRSVPQLQLSTLVNDFESSVFPAHPAIATLKADLLALGASYAAMSGSGSTVFGLFATREDLLAAAGTLRHTRPDCLLFHE